jgi:hypothetical protein
MRVLTGPLLSVAVRVDEGHGGGRGHGGHASAEDTTSRGSDGLGAGHQVGGGIAVLILISSLAETFSSTDGMSIARLGTYRAQHTSLKVVTLETRQQKSRSVAGSDGSRASQDSDGVETHDVLG